MRITESENQMRAQRESHEIGTIGGEELALCDRFGEWVIGQILGRIWQRFVAAIDVVPRADDAWCAGEDEFANAMLPAGRDHVSSADDVGGFIFGSWSPNSGFRCNV